MSTQSLILTVLHNLFCIQISIPTHTKKGLCEFRFIDIRYECRIDSVLVFGLRCDNDHFISIMCPLVQPVDTENDERVEVDKEPVEHGISDHISEIRRGGKRHDGEYKRQRCILRAGLEGDGAALRMFLS